MKTLALVVTLIALPCAAQCVPISSCFCTSPARVGVVVTQSIAGARSTVRVESATAGLDAGALLELPREGTEAVGSRWLVLDLQRRLVDDAGTVGCGAGSVNTPRLAVEAAATAVTHEQCAQELSDLGFVSNGCDDIGRSCSTAPLAVLPLLALVWALRRHRRTGTDSSKRPRPS